MDNGLWISTLWFGFAGILLYLPLFRLLPEQGFRDSRRAVIMGASIFWLAFTTVLVTLTWEYYYRFFYPEWMKWGAALITFILYPIYAFACHWLACHLPGHPMLWFCLLTGLLAANEHYLAWTYARLPEKVPMLAEMPLVPTMIFAFFEYQVFWAGTLWLAWILLKLSHIMLSFQTFTERR